MALLLCACADDSRPSAAQNDQLDNAAEMLNAAPDVLAGIDDNALGEPVNTSANQD